MSLPPYPGPGDSSGEEPGQPETAPTPPMPPTQQPYGGQPAAPYGQQPGAPYGQQPGAAYGQQPGAPYGKPPYGYNPYAGPDEAGRSWSGTAIAAFSVGLGGLILCGAPGIIAVILGIIALFRTGDGKGRGRWMAVTGLGLGALGTILIGGLVAGGFWIFNNTIGPDNAEVGMCVNVDEEDDEVMLWKKDCSDSHDAEIFGVHELTSDDIDSFERGRVGQIEVCFDSAFEKLDGLDKANRNGEFEMKGENVRIDAVLNDPEDPAAGDKVACYVQSRSGKLDEQLLD